MKLRKIIKKKGDITDSLALLITLFILAMGLFLLAWIIPQIATGLSGAGLNSTVEGTAAIAQLSDFGMNGIQKGFFFLFIGLCIAELISAFYLDSHPVWLFLYIIFLALTIILGAYLGNAYEQLINTTAFAGFSQGYITIIMQNIIKITVGIGALSMIIIFSKFMFGGGNPRM